MRVDTKIIANKHLEGLSIMYVKNTSILLMKKSVSLFEQIVPSTAYLVNVIVFETSLQSQTSLLYMSHAIG